MTHRTLPLLALLIICVPIPASARAQQQNKNYQQRQHRQRLPAPDFANEKYGPHRRNVYDVWLAKSDRPTPLVVYYHGGGFRGGDKRSLNGGLLHRLLEAGISVAAANYRLTDVGPYPMQMLDSARALQTIRHNAKKYNIDPRRVGATGGSAGAGISMWLAFHEDLADPSSTDPIARQSTRLSCAVLNGGQTSYDPRVIMKLFNTDKIHPALITFFDMKDAKDLSDPVKIERFEDSSAINHLTSDDPPVLLYYGQANKPLPPNSTGRQHIHHPKFGAYLKEKADGLGVEVVIKHREDYEGGNSSMDPTADQVAFFIEKLK